MAQKPQEIDLVRDSTLRAMLDAVRQGNDIALAQLQGHASAATIDGIFAAQLTGDNTDEIFLRWWAVASGSDQTPTQLLSRWFDLMQDEHVYGVKFYKYDTNASPEGVLTHESEKLGRCVPGTNSTPAVDPYRNTPAFWTREVAYEIENKDVVIKAVAGVGGVSRAALLSGKYGMVGVAQKTGWVRDTEDAAYTIHEYRAGPAYYLANPEEYRPLPEAVRVDGTLRPFVVHAKYAAGRDHAGKLTSASGLAVVNFISQATQATEWRKRGPDYSGMSGCDNAFRLRMFWHKYGRKGNSGTLEGCTGYNYQYTAAVSETGVTRVLLTDAQAKNLLVGSTVSVGVQGDNATNDRGYSSMRKDADLVRITSITDATVGEQAYKAVNLETKKAFNTVAGTTILSTMPWHSGSCDNVQGTDGSPTSNTAGKEPYIIQGLETQQGDYVVIADQLIVQASAPDAYTHRLAFFRQAAQIKSTADAPAVLSDHILTMPPDTAEGWKYIEDVEIDKEGNMYPAAVGRAGSTTGCKAALYVLAPGAHVYAVWAWALLYNWGYCGLSCVLSNSAPSTACWFGLAGVCGSGCNRGEYAAG